MDPQAALQRIIDAYEACKKLGYRNSAQDPSGSELADAFDALGDWLRSGGFPPVATGPIFGTHDVAVGFPGMLLHSLPRYSQRVKCFLLNTPSHARYSIMVVDPNDHECREWCMAEYSWQGHEINKWPFPTGLEEKQHVSAPKT